MRTSSPRLVVKPIALAVALALAAPHALAAPVGHTVVAGDVQVTQPNAQAMVITQRSDKAILNWRGFSIAAGETVQFVQPNSGSVALNRVTTSAPSEIFGRLSANGKVFLVNPSGVMFGKGASVDVGGLVASTLDLADDDFLAGRYAFADSTGRAGAVRNEGVLAAAERGTIALLGAQVSNGGTVTARLGTVGLAAGGKVTLDFNGDGLTRIVVDAARINALVENGGAIISDGGLVTMSARDVGTIADSVVRQQGVVQARALVERNGRIVLDGGRDGNVELAGKIDATGLRAGLRGGEVALTGRDIKLAAGSAIDVSGDAGGGSVLVGGDYQGANPLFPHAASTTMAAGATIRADALGNGSGGKVVLWSGGLTSAHGSASARGGAQGGNGGIVETSGRTLDVAGMRVTAGAAKGTAGTWLLDPGDITIDEASAAAISDSLNNSTNVTVSTRNADTDGPGDIFVNANIEKTAGADSTLLLEASNNITVSPGVAIAASGSAGKLHVDFSADWDNSAGGAVALLEGSVVRTNGGDVRIYGQDNPATGRARGSGSQGDGVLLRGAMIDSRAGSSTTGASGLIAIAGEGGDVVPNCSCDFGPLSLVAAPDGVGVRIADSYLMSGSGGISITGVGGTYSPFGGSTRDANGVVINLVGGPRIASGSGALSISGTAGSAGSVDAATAGLLVDIGTGSDISSTGGAITFRGTGRHTGGVGVDLTLAGGAIRAGGAVSMEGTGGVLLALDGSTLVVDGALSLTGTGAPTASGVALSLNSAGIVASSVSITGTGGTDGDGITVSMQDGIIDAGAGGLTLVGTGQDRGNGVAWGMNGGRVVAAGPVSLLGTGGGSGNGVVLSMSGATMTAEGARLAIAGSGGAGGNGALIDLNGSTLSAAEIAVSGNGGLNGAGVSGSLISAGIEATNGGLTIDGTGGGAGAGVDLFMTDTTIGARQGDLLITGTGGNAGGAGVLMSSFDREIGTDGSSGSNGVMTSSNAFVYADHGNLTIAGTSQADSAGTVSTERAVAGLELTGIELQAIQGDVLVAGAGVAGRDVVPAGVALTNVLATTGAGMVPAGGAPSTAPAPGGIELANANTAGSVRILAGATGAAPALILDGVALGSAAMQGNIIIGARNGGAGSVFSYPGTSQWANRVETSGVINLRPDDGNIGYGGLPASTVPISVGGGAGFNVSFADLGIGVSRAANVVVGSAEHTGQITFRDQTQFLGNLTLQNGGAGSEGIVLASNLGATGLVTLSSGGNVSAPGFAIDSGGLLLHGSQPEATFVLDSPANNVGSLAAVFDRAASAARPEYGDLSFRNNGPLVMAALSGNGFSSIGNQATEVAAAGTVVAGDLLVRSAGRLALAQGVSTLGGNITLVTDAFLDTGGHALAPGGAGTWRVFADTWVGENRGALTPSLPHPNYYNCAYGDACSAAITGNRFIYRAQPTLTLTADNLARSYGSANPALSFSPAGLVNGDTLADALVGAYATPALQLSSVGAYPITGAFTSPVGYAINARPGTLTIDRAALLISVDDKSKVYGAADPALSATFSGLAPGETAAVVTGLTLSAPTGALATAGSHPILGANAAASNYVISYREGTLTVAQAPLTYVADPAVQLQGGGGPTITGGVTGFVYGDTLATATSGSLQFAALAPPPLRPGLYAVEGRGLSAANYRFVQAPLNATALTILPLPANDRPRIAKDITFESSNVYEKNFGSPRLCVGTGPLGSGSAGADSNDLLALEWSRVRVSPNLSNCLGLGQRNSCQDF